MPFPDSSLYRVGLISPAWPAGRTPNGIVTYVDGLRSGLKQLGIESSVIAARIDGVLGTAEAGEVFDASSFPVSLPLRATWKAAEKVVKASTLEWRFAHAITQALKAAHRQDPLDLFEIEESFGAAWLVQDTIPRPMIVRLHGPWCQVSPALGLPSDSSYERRVRFEGRSIRDAHAVSSPSRHALESVRRHYRLELPDAEVIPNPIPVRAEEQRFRYADCDKKTLLFVGRFDRVKGGDLVLDAFFRLASEEPSAELVFVGPDRGLRDERGKTWTFEEYLAAKGAPEIASRVRFLGELPSFEITRLRQTSFLTIVASRFETFGMTALEALAHGCPLVGPRAAGIAEIIEDGKTGLFFAAGDSDDLARQLLRLFRDPELAARLGGAGAEDVARRFAAETVARAMCEFYARVRARAHAPGTRLRRASRSMRTLFSE